MNKLPKVLFVCVENSCRSQMAEAFAKIHGQRIIKTYSAGSRPSGNVNPKAIDTMKELGYDLTKHTSKSLQDIPTDEYEYAITMGCGDECPFVMAKHREDWKIPDPKHMSKEEFREVRDLIESKVKDLILSISKPNVVNE
ncbi:MAG: arsenate reductase ArsC [Acidobacteria bacterium]|nr:arsenate reductase ArsC [Acidobacteriota bacterium]